MTEKHKLERAVFWDRELNAEKRNKPDNYVDPELFLKLLVVNPGFTKAAYLDLVLDSLVVNQQISLVISLFLLHFSGSLIVGCFVTPLLLYWTPLPLAQAFICAVLLLVLTPIFMTLTDTYDTDTVYALVAACALIHLYTYDYKYANTVSTRLDCTLSLNSAFMMALLLASRMSSTYQAFAFLLTSVFLVIFLPPVLHELRKSSQFALACANVIVLLLLQCRLGQISSSLCTLHLASVGVVTFLIPLALYFMQGQKRILSGPWEILQVPFEEEET